MAEPLKRCPLCGRNGTHLPANSDPAIESWDWYGCTKCNIGCRTLEDWNRRAPSPATKAMLLEIRCALREGWDESPISPDAMEAFLAEWADTTPSTCNVDLKPGTFTIEASPWKCAVCDEPVRIAEDLTVTHLSDIPWPRHEAELSAADREILADGLRLSD